MQRVLTMYYRGTAGQFREAMWRVILLHRPRGWQAPTGEEIGWGEDPEGEGTSACRSWHVLVAWVAPQERPSPGAAGIESFDGPDGTTAEFLDGYLRGACGHWKTEGVAEIGPAFDTFAGWLGGELGLSAAPCGERPTAASETGARRPGARKGDLGVSNVTDRIELRAEALKELKQDHPDLSYPQLSLEANKRAAEEGEYRDRLSGSVTEDQVRYCWRRMGWAWERADGAR